MGKNAHEHFGYGQRNRSTVLSSETKKDIPRSKGAKWLEPKDPASQTSLRRFGREWIENEALRLGCALEQSCCFVRCNFSVYLILG